MKIRTLIVDDEPIALEKLKGYVEKVPFLELAGCCQSGFEALEILASTNVDAVFTDINMPDLNGLDFIGSLTKVPFVVFITAYSQYAVESYRLAAVDYLLKPYSFADFQRAANRVREQFAARVPESAPTQQPAAADDSVFVKVDYRYVRVRIADIRYIKGYGEYLQIYVEGEASPLMTLSSFSAIADRLPDYFLQVHRSYIVNMNRVEQISRGRVVMDKDTYIPVSDGYRNVLQQYLQSHSVGAPARKPE